MDENILLKDLNKINTTTMGVERIRENLGLSI